MAAANSISIVCDAAVAVEKPQALDADTPPSQMPSDLIV